jgi:hypothetical protein
MHQYESMKRVTVLFITSLSDKIISRSKYAIKTFLYLHTELSTMNFKVAMTGNQTSLSNGSHSNSIHIEFTEEKLETMTVKLHFWTLTVKLLTLYMLSQSVSQQFER